MTNHLACTGCATLFNRTWCFGGPFDLINCGNLYVDASDAYHTLSSGATDFCMNDFFGPAYGDTGGVHADLKIYCHNSNPAYSYVSVRFLLDGVVEVEYQLAFEDFDCAAGSWVLDRVYVRPADPFCDWPTTITLTSGDDCSPPAPPEDCACWPKDSYSPHAHIVQTENGSCDDCACVAELDLCFLPDGDIDVCTWRCDFSAITTGEPGACWTAARYATLDLSGGDDPDNALIRLYNVSNTLLATFEFPLASFNCESGAQSFTPTYSSDVCEWSTATCVLDMDGGACGTCSCDTTPWSVSIEYDGDTHTFCLAVGCDGTSELSEIFGAGGDGLYIEVEFGTKPANYARIRVYYLPFGDAIGTGTLIGVYNFLSDFYLNFDCDSATNQLDLATGNAGQCGYLVDESGYTELLGAAAFLSVADSCCTPGTETLTSSGSVVVPAGADQVVIEVWAAGGGGRGRGLISGGGGGGSGGGYSKTTLTGSVSGSYTCTIGAPGVGGGTGASGTDASNSDVVYSASTVCKALGGVGAVSGTGAASAGTASAVGDVKYAGGAGGTASGSGSGGGGGGGSAGTASAGNTGSNGSSGGPGGAGGAAVTDGGAGGDGGDNSDSPDAAASGANPGGGGGGAGALSGADAGDGGTAKIKITWTCA